MKRHVTNKNHFFGLLHRAIQPIGPKAGGKEEGKKHGGYNGKQIRQRKTEDTSGSPSDKSRQ